MKIRVTLMTENDSPAESIGKTKEERNANAVKAWNLFLAVLRVAAMGTSDRIELESLEVLDDTESE